MITYTFWVVKKIAAEFNVHTADLLRENLLVELALLI